MNEKQNNYFIGLLGARNVILSIGVLSTLCKACNTEEK